jgi:hypothetical protein
MQGVEMDLADDFDPGTREFDLEATGRRQGSSDRFSGQRFLEDDLPPKCFTETPSLDIQASAPLPGGHL